MNHTKEPWRTYKGNTHEIFVNDGDFIASSEDCHVGHNEAEANAKRIIACVNACTDVENEKLTIGYVKNIEEKAKAYDRLMSGKPTQQEVATMIGFPIAMNCYSSGNGFQLSGDWHWFTVVPFIDGENDCWTIKRGMWGRVPYGLLDGYVGDWRDSLTIPERRREDI